MKLSHLSESHQNVFLAKAMSFCWPVLQFCVCVVTGLLVQAHLKLGTCAICIPNAIRRPYPELGNLLEALQSRHPELMQIEPR